MVTIGKAIEILIQAGKREWADYFQNWTNCNGNKGGWDGHIRKVAPELVPIIWPNAA